MSNHAVGFKMQKVAEEVLKQYDKNNITSTGVRELITKPLRVVDSSDGNEAEFF